MKKPESIISPDKKLSVIFRVEPGCLGPEGRDHIVEFCRFSEEQLGALDSHFVQWQLIPRLDKTLPEIEYLTAAKKMNREQAEKYLAVFGREIDEFEEALQENISLFADQFFGR
ncbi:MAG: hypothetical protein QM709_02350 [Spongiibacteraceae bacterium]